jgi:hypothetical protein
MGNGERGSGRGKNNAVHCKIIDCAEWRENFGSDTVEDSDDGEYCTEKMY